MSSWATRSPFFPSEIPPTAGLPLQWGDFHGAPSLELGLATFIGTPEVQIECSGTAALIIALETLKLRSTRRTIVIPAYTCPLVPLAIKRCGLHVQLCDIQANRFDFDEDSLNRTVDSDTLAIVPTHLAGSACALDSTLHIAKRAGAFIIEDAAQSLGTTHRADSVGMRGDIGFFSLAAGKGLTLYEGGILIARDAEMRAALRETSRNLVPRQIGMEVLRLIELMGYRMLYNPIGLRFTYGANLRRWLARGQPARAVGDVFADEIPLHRVSALRKNIGTRALARLRAAIVRNVLRAHSRVAALESIPGLTVIHDLPESRGTWPFLMVLFELEHRCAAALAELWTAGLGVSKLFVHELQGYDYLKKSLPEQATPNARAFAARHLTITNSPWLCDADFGRILDVLRAVSKC